MTTLYDRLGVAATASPEELRAAYRRRARAVHPDRQGAAATEEMAELNAAWRVLSDPVARRAYDAGLTTSTAAVSTSAPPSAAAQAAREDADEWEPWDPEGLDPRGRVLRWLLIVVSITVTVALAALFLYAFTASPQVTEGGSAQSITA